MTTYDLDRWSRSISKNSQDGASLTLHLHPTHCRFEHQNGVFLYDSPIRSLLENIRDARLPVELLDLLDATDVVYYEGCLVVEIHDHREFDLSNAEGDIVGNGLNHPLSGGLASFSGNGSVLGKRGNDGTLLNKQQSGATDKDNTTGQGSSSSSSNFRRTLLTTFRRFEEARREASKMAIERGARIAAANAVKAAAAANAANAQAVSASAPSGSPVLPSSAKQVEAGKQPSLPTPGLSGMSFALHSAVAAAVAAAPSNPQAADKDPLVTTEKQQRPPIAIYRVVLGPDIETVWTDLLTMKEEKKRSLSEDDLLEIESRVLALTAPPLCLEPDMQVSRIANALMDATSLPYDSPIPFLTSTQPKRVKKLKKATRIDGQTTKSKKAKRSKPPPSAEDIAKLAADRLAAEEEALTSALEAERLEAQSWLLIMDEKNAASSSLLSRHGAGFQPSFSRFAFLLDYRNKMKEENEKRKMNAGEGENMAGPAGAGSVPQSPNKQHREINNQLNDSRSASHSRQGSIIDVPVPGGSTSNRMDIDDPKALNTSVGAGNSTTAGTNPVKKKKKAAAAGGDNTTAGTGPTSLKLTLPGKKSETNKKKAAAKAGSPDISVGSPPVSATGSSGPASAKGNQQQPTAAQQAIMRKTANLPKAKLKGDVKNQVKQGSPAAPGAGTGTLPPNNNIGQNMVNNLALPNMGMQNQINNNQQRNNSFSSPMQVQGVLPPQQQQQQQLSQQQALQQAYSQLQQNSMLQQGRQMTGSPFNNGGGMQLPGNGQQQAFNLPPNGQQQQPGNNGQFMNIHRSPVYNNAALPIQNQTPQPNVGYNPYNPSASPSSNQQMQMNGQQPSFTSFQLQQLAQQQQQQQNSLMHHQQALQNHVSSLPQNFNAANLFANGQQGGAAAGPNGQPQIQIPPQQGGGQGGNVPQFNPAMLNQLRQQQLLAGNGQQGYVQPGQQQQQQQMQWNGPR